MAYITIDEIRSRIIAIRKAANLDDHEAAHVLEAALHADVMEAIALGATNARDLACEAMRSKEINFSRWFS